MKRVVIFLNGTDDNGKMFVVCHSLEELLAAASTKFKMNAKRIFTQQGGEVDDVELIRDDDILYVSSGENYIHKDKSQNNEANKNSKWITLNVGGKYFTTSRDTLTKQEPMSMLARMFAESADAENIIQPSKQDHLGAYLIDRSPLYFEPLLNFLRDGQMILDPNINIAGVLAEAQFYGIEGAIPILSSMLAKEEQARKEEEKRAFAIRRREVLRAMCARKDMI